LVVEIKGKCVCLLTKKQDNGTERKVVQVAQIDPESGFQVYNVAVKDFNGYEVDEPVEIRARVGVFLSDKGKAYLTVKGV